MIQNGAITLNLNEVFNGLSNMIISQEVIGDRIRNKNSLVNKAFENVGNYGDTKLYISGDTLAVYDWAKDTNGNTNRDGLEIEASNLLACNWAPDPILEKLTINVFKQIYLTTEETLTKRAFIGEYAFGSFLSYQINMITKTRDIYFETNYDAYIGNEYTEIGDQKQELSLTGLNNQERSQAIAKKLADILLAVQKVSRAYNDNGQTTEWSSDDFKVIWNSKYATEIQKLGIPTIFHNENLIPKFDGDVLHQDFFGNINTQATAGDGSTIFAYKDQFLTVDGETKYIRAGELIPNGVVSKAGESYTKNDKVICKLITKYPPVLKSFELSRTFENPRSGTTNRYLRFGHSTFDRIHAEAFITLFEVENEETEESQPTGN